MGYKENTLKQVLSGFQHSLSLTRAAPTLYAFGFEGYAKVLTRIQPDVDGRVHTADIHKIFLHCDLTYGDKPKVVPTPNNEGEDFLQAQE